MLGYARFPQYMMIYGLRNFAICSPMPTVNLYERKDKVTSHSPRPT